MLRCGLHCTNQLIKTCCFVSLVGHTVNCTPCSSSVQIQHLKRQSVVRGHSMARYFFDFIAPSFSAFDDEGTDCADMSSVSEKALSALCEIAADHPHWC